MIARLELQRRPLRGAGPDELVHSVHETMRAVIRHIQPTLADERISTGQFWALHLVSSLQSASVSAVARHLAVSAPTVCTNVDQLEAEGLVSRRRSEEDHRSVELTLTPKGRRVEARIWARIGQLMNQAAHGLPSEDIATSVRVFQELQRRLETPGATGRGKP